MEISRPSGTLQGYHFEAPFPTLSILSHCGEETCGERHRVGDHEHDRFEICYLVRGNAWWQTKEQIFAHQQGEAFVAFPGEWHRTAPQPHGPYHILYAGIEFASLGPSGTDLAARLYHQRIHIVPHCEEIAPILRGIIRQIGKASPLAATVATHLLQAVATILLQQLDQPKRSGERGVNSIEVQNVLLYMRQHTDRRIELSELAEVAALSESQLSRRFRQEVGSTPAATHLRMRLDASRESLCQPGFDVTRVAYQFGFSSPSHFCRAFTRAFELSPRQWRHRHAADLGGPS